MMIRPTRLHQITAALSLLAVHALAVAQDCASSSSSSSAAAACSSNQVPEPGSLPLVVLALVGVVAVGRLIRRRK